MDRIVSFDLASINWKDKVKIDSEENELLYIIKALVDQEIEPRVNHTNLEELSQHKKHQRQAVLFRVIVHTYFNVWLLFRGAKAGQEN